jgi:hypothetical protein
VTTGAWQRCTARVRFRPGLRLSFSGTDRHRVFDYHDLNVKVLKNAGRVRQQIYEKH